MKKVVNKFIILWHNNLNLINVESLTLDDLKVVQHSMWDARTKWFNLGLQLNVKPTSLVAIQQNNKEHTDACMNEMLIMWLNQSNPPPTWSSLVAALKQSTVGLGQLADSIECERLKPIICSTVYVLI